MNKLPGLNQCLIKCSDATHPQEALRDAPPLQHLRQPTQVVTAVLVKVQGIQDDQPKAVNVTDFAAAY